MTVCSALIDIRFSIDWQRNVCSGVI